MLEVSFDGVKYVARLSIDQKPDVIDAGFFWDAELKKFTSVSHEAAYRLFGFCTPHTQAHIVDALDLGRPSPNYKKIDWPVDKKPFAHQIEFVKWAMSRRHSYIAGEPGTGKTPAAVMCMNAEPGPVIIVCPAFLQLNWQEEISSWEVGTPRIVDIVRGQKHFFEDDADCYIVPASVAHVDPIREYFFNSGRRFQWVFIDEAHMFKNPGAKRTQSIIGGRVQVNNKKKVWRSFKRIAEHVVFLSGSPMPNGRPLEMFPILSKYAGHVIDYRDKHRFGIDYCDARKTDFGWQYNGASNLETFNKKITSDFMIVKRLEECVDLPPMLPPKFIYLEDQRAQKHQVSEMQILKNVRVEDIVAAEMARNEEFAERVEFATHRAALENKIYVDGGFQFLSELRKLNGLKKVDQSVEVITEILDDLDELVVFAWHKEVVHLLAEALAKYEPFVITGSTMQKKRHASIKEFQQSRTRNLFLANIQAAGVGVTLTKAARYLFVEPSWVPGENDQAIRRLFRITQEQKVHGSFLVWKNSLDHLILNAHQKKNKNIDRGIHGR